MILNHPFLLVKGPVHISKFKMDAIIHAHSVLFLLQEVGAGVDIKTTMKIAREIEAHGIKEIVLTV